MPGPLTARQIQRLNMGFSLTTHLKYGIFYQLKSYYSLSAAFDRQKGARPTA
jgi:hypothetical protein